VKENSGRKSNLPERDRRILRRIFFRKNHRTTAAQITGDLDWILVVETLFPQKLPYIQFTNPTSTAGLQLLNSWSLKVMLRCLSDGVATIKRRHHTTGNSGVIWTDKSFFTLFPASGRVYLWKTFKETCNPECLVPRVKQERSFVTVWAAISWYSFSPIITLYIQITAKEYVDRLGNLCVPWSRCFIRTTMQFSKTTTPLVAQLELFSWKHGGELQHLPWPTQSPDFNITEPLWSVLETEVGTDSNLHF
jgi:hypothetical protein